MIKIITIFHYNTIIYNEKKHITESKNTRVTTGGKPLKDLKLMVEVDINLLTIKIVDPIFPSY